MNRARGRCPLCGSTQFAVELDANGRPVKARCFYNHCPPTAILAAMQGTALDQLKLAPTADPARNQAAALRTWNVSQSIEGTLGERYLREARGITIKLPASLRYNANILHPTAGRDTFFPALI
jgi:hypothetical protein